MAKVYIDSNALYPDNNLQYTGEYASKITAIAAGDFDGDGDKEIATAIQDGNHCTIYVSDDGITINQHSIYSSNYYRVTAMVAGDFYGEGRDRLVTAFWNGTYNETAICFSDIGKGQSPGTNSIYHSMYYHATAMAAGDFYGEGRDRLVTAFWNGTYNETQICFSDIGKGQSPGSNSIYHSMDSHVTAMAAGSFRESLYDPAFLWKSNLGKSNNKKILPVSFHLNQNYPNPFNLTTQIQYDLPRKTDINLTVYNILGKKIMELVNEEKLAGSYIINWNGENEKGFLAQSGVYICKMRAENITKTIKMLMLK